jgi:hypothetical protein
MTDLDDLIRNRHGDVKKLREIRDTIRHDNFITADAKKYIESLISVHLKNQPLDKILPPQQTDTKIQLQSKPNANILDSNDLLSNFSSNKKLGILVGVAAAIAIIVIVGFTATDFTSNSILSKSILVNVDKTTYQRADIISITGDVFSNAESVQLSIENTSGVKIWNEIINPKNNGKFSTLVIAGGGGWENDGVYTLKAMQDDLVEETKFHLTQLP